MTHQQRKAFLGNIKLWIYSPQIFTSSTRPAIEFDSGQISAGSSTSLNYDKVRRRLCPYTKNTSGINDSMYHHCYVVTRPTRVRRALTTIFVMAGGQGLRKTCTRLHKNKLMVIEMYQQQSPRYLSIATEAWAVEAKRKYFSVFVANFAKKNMRANKFCCPNRALASSKTFFPVTCDKTHVGCEREKGSIHIRNADTISLYGSSSPSTRRSHPKLEYSWRSVSSPDITALRRKILIY